MSGRIQPIGVRRGRGAGAGRRPGPVDSSVRRSGGPRDDTGTARGPTPVVLAVAPELWCELLRERINREPDLRVVGCAGDEATLGEAISTHSPRAVVLDYEAMGPNTEDLIARLHRAAPEARVLVLARRVGNETVSSVLRAGAAGHVAKNASTGVLMNALRAVVAGQVWANRHVTAQVISELVSPGRTGPDGTPTLTRREWEVVDAVTRGLRNREIARVLRISEKTVKSHLNTIFTKTRVPSRIALALWAQGQVRPRD